MIADEVGLGKTVEVGLILKELLDAEPGLRVLYLAPARLVSNVRRELDRLELSFRSWVAGSERDATLSDRRVIASIHRAAHPNHTASFTETSWDVLVVDECHHLSDWAKGGGKAVRKFRLVDELQSRLPANGRLILLSGTPHQGHRDRFSNLVRLLRSDGEPDAALSGRVIYRTKEDVRDWHGRPLFPRRQVNPATILELSPRHESWLRQIHELFEAPEGFGDPQGRAAGWRAGQALQWATSSVQAGLGYLVRQAIRAGWTLGSQPILEAALRHLRPYRGGDPNEAPAALLLRVSKEVRRQGTVGDVADIEEDEDEERWRPDPALLVRTLEQAIEILRTEADAKWELIDRRLLGDAGDEKVVLFAQPVETVTALCDYLERKTGQRPAMIVGNQTEEERQKEIETFWREKGPQYLVSSKAGGEGINLQLARRLVHVDVPWNPMDLEQRVGRVHRFMSRRTILVDTVVVKGSREEDMYAVARRKLEEIAATLVPAEKLEMLFSRVMALVPPEELSAMLGDSALGPLTDEERAHVSSLVTAGFERWREFHDTYASVQEQIQALDAGSADWQDLADFAERHLGADSATGFAALRFCWDEGEVREDSVDARVLRIGNEYFACGDHGGMPVTRSDGARARPLGLNLPAVAAALRQHGLGLQPGGAAHLRWADDATLPSVVATIEPVLLLVVARESIRSADGRWREAAVSLATHVRRSDGSTARLVGKEQAEVFRALLRAKVRAKPWEVPELLEGADAWHDETLRHWCRPSEGDQATSTRHAAFAVLATIVGG
ncbi:MAG: DEAD/DEAH box helicase [Myxococcales bacterium]|nr:DEAD/DEAH box helicase [Myxococcales bacterium]